ncbi:MAG: hypothetical protein SH817_00460 [Leptospira sp.]|nr:hypothetical protein [Leptospira sp.]
MNKIFKFTILFALCIALLASSCKEEKKDDNSLALLLLLSSSANTNSATSLTQTASVRAVSSGVSSSISSGIQSGVSFHLPSTKMKLSKNELMAYIHKNAVRASLKNQVQSYATALQKEEGTCTTSSCTATLSGTVDCTLSGVKSGTAKLDKVKVEYTNGTNGLGYKMKIDGKVTLDKCGARSNNWLDFPSQATAVTTGDVTFVGTNNIDVLSYTTSGSGSSATTTFNLKYSENNTINSSALTINSDAAVAIKDLKSVVDLAVVSISSNVTSSFTATTLKFTSDYKDTLTGTVNVTGTVGSGSVNQTKVYSGDVFNYNVACDLTYNSTNGTITGDCKTTKK